MKHWKNQVSTMLLLVWGFLINSWGIAAREGDTSSVQKIVVVTGASGHVGISLLEELLKDDTLVVRALYWQDRQRLDSLVRRMEAHGRSLGERLTMHEVNITAHAELATVFQGATAVIHLAALISIHSEPEQFTKMSTCNIQGTRSVLAAAKQAGIKTFIHCSSLHAYRHNHHHPLSCKNGLQCEGKTYDATKGQAQQALYDFAQENPDFAYVVIAPGGIVGRNDHRNCDLWPIFERYRIVRFGPVPQGGYTFVDVRQVSAIMHEALQQLFNPTTRDVINRQEFMIAGRFYTLQEIFTTLQEVTRKSHCLNWGWGNCPVTAPLSLLSQLAPWCEKAAQVVGKKSLITPYSMAVLASLPLGVAAEEQEKVAQFFGELARPLPLKDTIEDRFAVHSADQQQLVPAACTVSSKLAVCLTKLYLPLPLAILGSVVFGVAFNSYWWDTVDPT